MSRTDFNSRTLRLACSQVSEWTVLNPILSRWMAKIHSKGKEALAVLREKHGAKTESLVTVLSDGILDQARGSKTHCKADTAKTLHSSSPEVKQTHPFWSVAGWFLTIRNREWITTMPGRMQTRRTKPLRCGTTAPPSLRARRPDVIALDGKTIGVWENNWCQSLKTIGARGVLLTGNRGSAGLSRRSAASIWRPVNGP